MKRVITCIIIGIFMLTCAYVPQTDSYAAAKAKYVKVKQATYNKMKKTIASQKKTIASQKKTITARNNTITARDKTINSLKSQVAEKDATIKDKKSTISWLWDQLEAFGYEYNYDSHQWESTQEPVPIENLDMQDATDVIPLLEEQTGLSIDVVRIMEYWKTWYCYYVEADGDLYVITVKNKVVDVISQLN